MNSELGSRIDAAIDVLLEDLKVAVILRYVQSLSNQEAAVTLDVSLSALKARLLGGRIALRYSLLSYAVERAKVD
jgi:DNA-directed RNA polymerase specialized sigma24 family protein